MKTAVAAAALLLAGAAVAAPVTSTPAKRNGDNSQDFEILNLARNIEALEEVLWDQVLANYTDADFAAAGFEGLRPTIELFRDQEIAHFNAVNQAALNLNPAPFNNCTYNFPNVQLGDILAFGQIITSVGEDAVVGALGQLSDGDVRLRAASILAIEAGQNDLLRDTLQLHFFNANNFQTSLTGSQAWSLIFPYLDCPASNPPVNFTVIPRMVTAFNKDASSREAGETIFVTWDASTVKFPNATHITFLNDVNAFQVPLIHSGPGVGRVTLPDGLNGTAILVATDFDGTDEIPDAQSYAISTLVVS